MTTVVPRYVEIEIQAHQFAEEEAKNMLDSELQLETLDGSKKNIEQTLMTTETQLHGTIQTYLDELSQVLNVITTCHDESLELQERFNKMKRNCEQTLETLQDSDVINKINLVQNNYSSVASQLSFLSSLTPSLENLHDKITKDYRSLRTVYDEWIKYLSWKVHIQEELRSIKTEEKRNQARHVFNPYFELIDTVGKEIHDKLWEHINRSIELGQYDPASLVRALFIIERADRRRTKSIENRDKKLPYQAWLIDTMDYKQELYKHLKLAIQRRCNNAYNQGTKLTEKLKIGMQLLTDLEIVRTKVVPCYPENYDILNFYVHEYALTSQSQLESIYNNNSLEPSEILSLIEWLESYNDEIISWGCQEIDEFNNAKGRLMGKFTDVVKTKLSEWILKLIDRKDVPSLTDSGYYATALPEDIYNLVKMQMQIATEHLKDKTLYLSIKVCVDSLSVYTDYVNNKIQSEGSLLEPEQLCCLINNTKRLADLIEGIPDVLEENFDIPSLNELKDYISKQSEKYLDICTNISIIIAHNIWTDIAESDIMSATLFSDDWIEEEDCQAMLTVLSTYEDYFDDLKKWINSKLFLGHTLKTCLETVVEQYFKCMCLSSYIPDEPVMMGSRIRRDYDEIMGYFTNAEFLSCMKYVKREFRVEEGVAQVLSPLRNLEIFFKLNEFVLVEDGKVTQDGFTYITEILSTHYLSNGIYSLTKFRTDFSDEAKAIIEGQFALFK